MKNPFFDQKMFNNFETPMQKLMELNVKMMQNLSYVKPMDLLSIKKPEEIFEKQIELFVQNSHMILDYMRTSFSILENHWSNASHNFAQNQHDMMNNAFTTAEKNTKKATTVAKNTAKKVAATANKSTSSTKKASSGSTTTHSKKDSKEAKSTKGHDTKIEKKKTKSTDSSPKKSSIIKAKEASTHNTSNTNTDNNLTSTSKSVEKPTTLEHSNH